MSREDNYLIPTIESVKEDISALGELLEKTEAVGVTGSMATGASGEIFRYCERFY